MGKVIIENQLLTEAPVPKKDENTSIFKKLFTPASAETSISSENDGRSLTSSNLSSLSESTDGSNDESSTGSDDDGIEEFDRELRGKHRNACKNMSLGKFSKAIKTFEEILADLLDRYGEEHSRVGASLHNVAVSNLRAGQLTDAKDAIEEAIRIRELTLGSRNSKVADSLVEYGIILLSMKEYKESLKAFRKALKIRTREERRAKKEIKAQDARLKIAKIRHNIGCVNFEMGRMVEADEAYSKAIEEQKRVFGTWAAPFMVLTDTTKPGFLTMASTMCNKGYIDLELGRYSDAVDSFMESISIQRRLLEKENKLILSTLENIGYSYCMQKDFEKAVPVYEELVKIREKQQTTKGWAISFKHLIFCEMKAQDYESAFDNLRLLEDYLSARESTVRNASDDLDTINELIFDANYQIFRFPSIADYVKRAVSCGICGDDGEGETVDLWAPTKPKNGSKMSGHRMSYA